MTMNTLQDSWWMKGVATLVLVTFLMWILEPTAVAAQVIHEEQQQAAVLQARQAAAALPNTLQNLTAYLTASLEVDSTRRTDRTDLAAWQQRVLALDAQVQQDFANIAAHLQVKQLPPAIVARHEQAVAEYQQHKETLLANLAAMQTAADDTQLRKLTQQTLDHLQPLQTQGGHPDFDPNQLPFHIPQVELPVEELEDATLRRSEMHEPVQVASTFLYPGMLLASAPPAAKDLLADDEAVQITEDIQALADSLGNQPVPIYNWVRNNIQFVPTHGSIQGSQMTLETRRGNATDTASLLIALLRASNIHARYAMGTVMMPIAKVMNWVGGVESPQAAGNLLRQGGIQATLLTESGVPKFMKLEQHVWVDAWIDAIPSRGARHIKGDSWLPLDASYKQYAFTDGLDLEQAVALDAEGLLETMIGADDFAADDNGGWVQGINNEALETALLDHQRALLTYVEQNHAGATFDDVLGSQTIIAVERPYFAFTLPYQRLSKQTVALAKPAFKFSLYANESARHLDNPLFSFTRNLPDIAGKRLTLSFSPQTEADAAVLQSFILVAPKGETIDIADFPTSFPGYLVKLTAELRLDGELVASHGGFTLGQELSSVTAISRLAGGWHQAHNKPIAGEFYAFGIDLQGVSGATLEATQSRLEVTKARLEAEDVTGLTKEDFVGDMLFAAAMGYFVANDKGLDTLNIRGDCVGYRLPSFGTISTKITPIYHFGIPSRVEIAGIMVDMDVVTHSLWAKNNDSAQTLLKAQSLGYQSSVWEHQIPEMFFFGHIAPLEGTSAVKALQVAAGEGQKIYEITQQNAPVIAQLMVDEDVKREIRDSVAVGKTVLVSEGQVTIGGWTGVGYIISDPLTGSGAYRISGGSNGGMVKPIDPVEELDKAIEKTLERIHKFSNKATDVAVDITEATVIRIEYLFNTLASFGIFISGIAGVFDARAVKVNMHPTKEQIFDLGNSANQVSKSLASTIAMLGLFISLAGIHNKDSLSVNQRLAQSLLAVMFAVLDFYASKLAVIKALSLVGGPVGIYASYLLGAAISVAIALMFQVIVEIYSIFSKNILDQRKTFLTFYFKY